MVVFSIITCTYNAESVLQRTLDSVARQTYKGVEHIIVDGASKDETVAMAEKYKEQSDQADNGHEVRILSEPDKGLYDAMNKGLRLATGDYIVYMNAGDIFALPKTLAMAAHAAETAADAARSRCGHHAPESAHFRSIFSAATRTARHRPGSSPCDPALRSA